MNTNDLLIKGKETVALRVSNDCQEYAEIGHIHIDVVYVRPDCGVQNESLGFYDNYYDHKHQYKGLKINCQMDRNNENPYGWELVIDNINTAGGINLESAETMVKVLRSINRKMKKIEDTEGRVDSYVEFVIRIVRCLGVKAYYTKRDNDLQFHLQQDIGSLRSHLMHLLDTNRQRLGFIKAA